MPDRAELRIIVSTLSRDFLEIALGGVIIVR
jgi:hypothetical protein